MMVEMVRGGEETYVCELIPVTWTVDMMAVMCVCVVGVLLVG
jgi:hypothetical protein